MSRRRQVLAVLICAFVALSMLASSACIAREAIHPHACTGEDCPVCQFIAHLEQVRRDFGAVLLALLLICTSLAVGRAWRAVPLMAVTALATPVGRKIRLNS